jgi:hypothetical protein
MKKATLALALLLTVACGKAEVVVDTASTEEGGLVACQIVCDYTDPTITQIRADLTACDSVDAPCSTCESCESLLNYHAARMSCEDGAGRNIQVVELTCGNGG